MWKIHWQKRERSVDHFSQKTQIAQKARILCHFRVSRLEKAQLSMQVIDVNQNKS
jgi:hypothetical protein